MDQEINPLLTTPLVHSTAATEDDCSEKAEEGKFKFSKLNRREKCTFALALLANFDSGIGYSLIAPFYPNEASKKGMSTTLIGLVFSIFELVIFISSPFFGNFLTQIGARFMFNAGIFVAGSSSCLFGTLYLCRPGMSFIVISFACRVTEALGISAFVTASFAIVSNTFPNHVATAFGIMETAFGVGLMFGPAIGGALYTASGFGLPFFVMGSVMLLNALLFCKFLPAPEDITVKKKMSMFRLFKSPMIWLSISVAFNGLLTLNFVEPVLAKHLDKFHLSEFLIGLIFIIIPVLYVLTAPIWGYVSDSKANPIVLLIIGSIVNTVGFLFVGPSPWLEFIPYELWAIIVGLVLIGLSYGSTVIASMKCFVTGALDAGYEDNLDTYGLVSGLSVSTLSAGSFTGPTVGAILVDQIGFRWCATLMAGCYVLMTFILILTLIVQTLRPKKQDEKVQTLTLNGTGYSVQNVEQVDGVTTRVNKSFTGDADEER